MPKTALHMHIEGSFEAKLAWSLATEQGYGKSRPLEIPAPSGAKATNLKNGKYQVSSLTELEQVYNFNDLESFLNVYNTLATLLKKQRTSNDLPARTQKSASRRT